MRPVPIRAVTAGSFEGTVKAPFGIPVLGINPNRDEVEEFEEPDPQTWRTIEVEQIKPSGKRLYATLLRPRE
jgi:hypothetical protein